VALATASPLFIIPSFFLWVYNFDGSNTVTEKLLRQQDEGTKHETRNNNITNAEDDGWRQRRREKMNERDTRLSHRLQ
jgi:hypothetical protein